MYKYSAVLLLLGLVAAGKTFRLVGKHYVTYLSFFHS